MIVSLAKIKAKDVSLVIKILTKDCTVNRIAGQSTIGTHPTLFMNLHTIYLYIV